MTNQADNLVPYGIQNEESFIRAHVCPVVGRVYVFETERGRDIIKKKQYRIAPAYTGGQKTAEGYLVPPEDIEGVMEFNIPDDLKRNILELSESTTSIKGRGAVKIVQEMMSRRLLTMPAILEDETSIDAQLRGSDLVVSNSCTVQVKCDWRGGSWRLGGTGNLYLQIAESNPNKAY